MVNRRPVINRILWIPFLHLELDTKFGNGNEVRQVLDIRRYLYRRLRVYFLIRRVFDDKTTLQFGSVPTWSLSREP